MPPANDNSTEIVWSHIELTAGTVTSSTIEHAGGTCQVSAEIGKFKFFVDAVEAGGGRLGLYSCEEYGRAVHAAEKARADFKIAFPVKDNVLGTN